MTIQQLQALKAAILADPVLSAFQNNGDGNTEIANYYNAPSSPSFYVWNTSVDVQAINDAIIWANLTPNDAPDTTQVFENRAMICQIKQMNLQLILGGRLTLNAAKANVRSGLQDALSLIPSGNGGATRSGGWSAVQLVLSRTARRVEQLFAIGTGTQAIPARLGFEGSITYQDVDAARNLPA